MTTHITNARQAVSYYMQGDPSETIRLKSLIDTYGDWHTAAESVRMALGTPRYAFGDARDGDHTATVENIADELRRRAEGAGVRGRVREYRYHTATGGYASEYRSDVEAVEAITPEAQRQGLHRIDRVDKMEPGSKGPHSITNERPSEKTTIWQRDDGEILIGVQEAAGVMRRIAGECEKLNALYEAAKATALPVDYDGGFERHGLREDASALVVDCFDGDIVVKAAGSDARDGWTVEIVEAADE